MGKEKSIMRDRFRDHVGYIHSFLKKAVFNKMNFMQVNSQRCNLKMMLEIFIYFLSL